MSIINQNIISQKTFDAIIKQLAFALEPTKHKQRTEEKIKYLDQNKEIEAIVVKFLDDVFNELESIDNFIPPTE